MAGWRNDDSLFQFTLHMSLPSTQERWDSELLVELALPSYIPWWSNYPHHVIKLDLISVLTICIGHLLRIASNLLNFVCLFLLSLLRQPASCIFNLTVPHLRCSQDASHLLWGFCVDTLVSTLQEHTYCPHMLGRIDYGSPYLLPSSSCNRIIHWYSLSSVFCFYF